MTVRTPTVGQRYQLARVTLWARARRLADGMFVEDGAADFPARSSRLARVLGPIDEEHVPCRIGAEFYWVPLDELGGVVDELEAPRELIEVHRERVVGPSGGRDMV